MDYGFSNLDSNNNFIYDGSGINLIGNKSGVLDLINLQNTNTSGTTSTEIGFFNNDATAKGKLKLNESNYVIESIYNKNLSQVSNALILETKNSPIILLSDVSGESVSTKQKILLGYNSGLNAFEIGAYGGVSFNSVITGDAGYPPNGFYSNYGVSGEQIMISMGSNAPPKWGAITDVSGGITTYQKNVNGIAYVRDASGNLDSSSNFIYDGSGLTLLTSKSANQNVLILGNTISGDGSAQTNITLKNDSSGNCFINYKSNGFNNVSNTIGESRNNFSFQNESGDIALIPSGSKKLLLGYQSGAKAVEINSYGAMSFDTSGNNDNPLTFTSNYGIPGQILTSRGSSANPQWSNPINTTSGNLLFSSTGSDISGFSQLSYNPGFNLLSIGCAILGGIPIFTPFYGTPFFITHNDTVSNQFILQAQLNNNTTKTKYLLLDSSGNDTTKYFGLELNSSSYHQTSNLVTEGQLAGILVNKQAPIVLASNGGVLFGYNSNQKAININNKGALSFDTSGNGDYPLTFTSNYGTLGQVMISQGSSSNVKWSNVTDLSGVITTYGRNIGGIAYIRDVSGNLDSSSNFIYDGSGITITSTKNSSLNGLTIQNTNTGGTASSDLILKNSANTVTIELKSTGYTDGTTIDAKTNMLSISNPSNSININSGDRTLFGYSSNTKAIEIASTGAVSFDTSNNSGTWVSNYGTTGQVLTSQGSSSNPKWTSLVNVPSTSLLYSSTGLDISGSSNIIFANNVLNTSRIESQKINLNINTTWINNPGTGSLAGYLSGAISNTNKILAASPFNAIYSSVPPYSSWTTELSSFDYWTGCAISGANMIACATGGNVWANIGSGWVQQSGTAPFSSGLGYVSVGISGTNMIACVNGGSVFVNTTGSWVQQTSIPTAASWYGVAISGTNMIACVNGGSVYYNFTGTWVNTGLASYGWRGVSIYDTNMIGCSSNGGVWTNFGSGWVQQSLSTGYNWSGVGITINNNMVASAEGQSVWLNFGSGWVDQSTLGVIPSGSGYFSCGIYEKSAVTVTSDTKQIYTLSNNILTTGEINASTVSGLKYIDVSGVGKGSIGQVLTSGGSSSNVLWNYIPQILYANSTQYASDISGSPLTLITPAAFTGLISGRTRIVTFTTSIVIYTNTTVTYTLYVNTISTASITMRTPINTPIQHTMIFNYSSATTSDTIYITATASGDVNVNTNDSYSLRFEQL